MAKRSAFRDLKKAAADRQTTTETASRAEEKKSSRKEELSNSRTIEEGNRKGMVRAGAKKVGLVLPEEMHRELRVQAAKEGCRVSALVERVLREYLGEEEF